MPAQTAAITEIDVCTACGGTDLQWQDTNVIKNGVPQGRARTTDVQCLLFLGCNECSETLAIFDIETIVQKLNSDV